MQRDDGRDHDSFGLKLFGLGIAVLLFMNLYNFALWIGLDDYVRRDSIVLGSITLAFVALIVFEKPFTRTWFVVCDWWSISYWGRR
jgi:hypothetical protein